MVELGYFGKEVWGWIWVLWWVKKEGERRPMEVLEGDDLLW